MKDEGLLPHRSTIFFRQCKDTKRKPSFASFPCHIETHQGKQGKNNGQQGKQQGKIKNPDTFIGILILFL